ncbi:hypothetical protein BC939DRAFT_472271 [Gamsiella multidivaricata]|uniref:uncharacterized protein n=1 Tax=Gamsiella multidivaricata TaxID=101098 RepID=UPI00221EDF63|nr:uncharacterized protein BC939DRAFT_472271 [Gamsiella multidivaricata]KAI7832680.1 hypothetical protein BC939DRAFT_472271 [Gamsiella multidivaricata]
MSNKVNEPQRKEPSKWQVGLERILKKIQRRKRAPSNLVWYATHSTESYLSGTTFDFQSGVLTSDVDPEAEELHFGRDQPPRWVVNSLQDNDPFFSDDTVDLMLGLRDYLVKATEDGWDIAELKEEIFPIESKSIFQSRRNRSVSPHGSPHRTSPIIRPSAPESPGAASQDSGATSRRESRGSLDFEYISQPAADRYADEEAGSYRLLDYFMANLSDVISHDCHYKIQHPRPSRPDWILHSIVLDILLYFSKALAHDHKAMYDIGMLALSAFPVFENNCLIRLLNLLTDMILPSFALARSQSFGSSQRLPSMAPLKPTSPLSPSEIRVQLDNNQTFAIQVHSPTEEQGMLAVPQRGEQFISSLGSPHIPSSRSSSTSLSRASPGPTTQAQDTMDKHASSLISLTLLAVLQQISFSKSPLPVVQQLQKSMGDLLRIKPDLSVDLLEVITIVENEKVVRQALEVMWWIGMPCLGHHILGEKFYPLDYDSVLFMRQSLQEWQGAETMGAITRNNTVKSDTVFSFRKDFIDEHTTPRNDASARNNSVGSFGIRSKRSYRSVLPWKTANGAESIPLSGSLPQQSNNSATTGADFLADHELYPYMFSSPDIEDDDANNITHCERCELNMKGFGLYCYHCRGALHLECFYSIKKYAGVDCMQLGCALDLVSRRSRNQLIYPLENCGNKSHIDMTCRIRAGHQLQLVNLFSTCLCAACKLPLWGLHYQAYRCQECSQLMHAECKGTVQDCGVTSQPLTLRHSFPTQISYGDLKQSFQEFFRELIAIWETYHPTAPLSPATPSSTQSKDRYSYEEASCNASTLTLQLEVFKAGIARGEIQVQEWVLEGQITDESCIGSSGFELLTLQKHFVDLVRLLRLPGHSTAPTLFLSDFFEDKRPDPLLLFSCNYWSHFAALAKTMIKDAEATRLSYSHDPFSPPAEDVLQGDIFTTSPDTGQDQLLAGLSAQTSHVSLSTIFRFCMRRLCFHSTWTMQLVLQEWVKIGLLERLDGELCLFENAVQDPAFSPPAASLFPQFTTGIAPGLPTFQTSYFDSINGENGVNNSCIHTPTFRNVHCLFSMATAIDPTPDVENLIHAIWRCLSSVDLSVNECGFLLLSRRCWPDPFMSQYTTERLLGCVFHWLLLEDSHLFDIHKNYTSKGKRIPGVRSDLEEQIGMRRTALSANNRPPRLGGPAESSTAAIGATAATETSGNTTSSLTAVTGGTILSATGNSRSSSANSSLFGTVGSYVMTRKLMAKKFALPWLKKVMNLDQEGYVDMTYRQIRILEREMAPEMKEQYVSKEEQESY